MNLEQKIRNTSESLDYHKKQVETLKEQLLKYSKMTDVTTPDLYKKLGELTKLESNVVFTINLLNTTYENILGGDGRSQPWSETKNGVVCQIECIHYLSSEQKIIVANYFKRLGKIDDFTWFS